MGTIAFNYENGQQLASAPVLENSAGTIGAITSGGTVVASPGTAMVWNGTDYVYEFVSADYIGESITYHIKYTINSEDSYVSNTIAATVATSISNMAEVTGYFTNIANVNNYLGQEGTELLIDDLSVPREELIRSIEEAHDFILQYALEKYDEVELLKSRLVSKWATELAVYFLFSRRGQQPPENIHELFFMVRDRLEEVAKSTYMIIPGAKPRAKQGPSISNYVISDFMSYGGAPRLLAKSRTSTTDYPEKSLMTRHWGYW